VSGIRIAVVGVSRMGLTHAENLARRVRGARLVAVTTSDAPRAAAARVLCADGGSMDCIPSAGRFDR
jgi:predicted dehydrogenase